MRITREVGHTALDWFARGTQVRYRLPGFATSEFLADCDSEEHARLIAAAPELLEMAHAFESYLEDNSLSERRREQCLAEIRAAISKAEGGQS